MFQIPSVDKYTPDARLIPALIVLLPVSLSLISLFPGELVGWDLIVWLGTSAGLGIFLKQLTGDIGKGKETELYRQWGGKPSTVLLRHRDSKLSRPTLIRYHEKLSRSVPIKLPTVEEEINNPQSADDLYDSCGDFLEAQTYDKDRFPLLFKENANYAFRRNLWGMKFQATILAILSILLVLTQVHPNWLKPDLIKPVALVALILDGSFLFVWLKVIKTDWVKTAAEACAEQLLSTIDVLEVKK